MPTDKTNQVNPKEISQIGPTGNWNLLSGNSIQKILDVIKSRTLKAGRNIQLSHTDEGTYISLERTEGACCVGEACSISGSEGCANAGGVYQGDNTACSPNPCGGGIIGACCHDDGTCDDTTEAECMDAGGNWQGNDTTCDDDPCPQPGTGACCSEGGCTITTSSECAGDYQGDDTTCDDPDICNTGACCSGDDCSVTTAGGCGGTFLGGGSSCDDCLIPGACCGGGLLCTVSLPGHCDGAFGVGINTCDDPCDCLYLTDNYSPCGTGCCPSDELCCTCEGGLPAAACCDPNHFICRDCSEGGAGCQFIG